MMHINIYCIYIFSVQRVGENVKPLTKGKVSAFAGPIEKVFSPAHVTLSFTNRYDITPTVIRDKVQYLYIFVLIATCFVDQWQSVLLRYWRLCVSFSDEAFNPYCYILCRSICLLISGPHSTLTLSNYREDWNAKYQ